EAGLRGLAMGGALEPQKTEFPQLHVRKKAWAAGVRGGRPELFPSPTVHVVQLARARPRAASRAVLRWWQRRLIARRLFSSSVPPCTSGTTGSTSSASRSRPSALHSSHWQR